MQLLSQTGIFLSGLDYLGHFSLAVLLSLHVLSWQMEVTYFCSQSTGQTESQGFTLTERDAGKCRGAHEVFHELCSEG